MEEKALCGTCTKQIDSDASTLKAVWLKRIIKVSEDIQDELADRIHRKILSIPIHARWRSYTKPSKITAAKKRKQECSIDIETQKMCESTAPNPNCLIHKQTVFFCDKTITFLVIVFWAFLWAVFKGWNCYNTVKTVCTWIIQLGLGVVKSRNIVWVSIYATFLFTLFGSCYCWKFCITTLTSCMNWNW